MSKKDLKTYDDLKESVLKRIEDTNLRPRSVWFWRVRSSSIWILWALSVLLGALSVAILIFAAAHVRFALFEATHPTRLALALEVMPYLWIGVFGLMAVLAYFNFRNTEHGYRYPLAHIVLSSVGFSLVGGVLLHMAGLGYQLDMSLGRMSDMYKSQEEMEISLWQRPTAGRLVGRLLPGFVSESEVSYRDIDGVTWIIKTTDLNTTDLRTLNSGEQTRLIGVLSTNTPRSLYGCGVFHWPFTSMPKQGFLEKERQQFVDSIYEYKEVAKEEAKELLLGDDEELMGPCSKLNVVERMQKR